MTLVTREQKQVTFLLPGALFPETETRNVRDFAYVGPVPNNAFAYELSVRRWAEDNITGEVYEAKPDKIRGRTYIGGEIYRAADVPDGVLKDNCRANGWDRMIRCRTGNWQPFTSEDRKVDAQ